MPDIPVHLAARIQNGRITPRCGKRELGPGELWSIRLERVTCERCLSVPPR